MFTSIMFIVLCIHKTHSDIDFILDNPCIADMMFLHEFHKYEDSSSNVTFFTDRNPIYMVLITYRVNIRATNGLAANADRPSAALILS